MLTRNRRKWLPKAIRCFQGQTYQNAELLIIADGEDVRDLIPGDARIRLVQIEGRTIGEKRNFGVELADGSIISHFDDDDWSAPERLTDQVQRLHESGLACTGYSAMYFTDGAAWWQWRYETAWSALGTSLCFLKNWWADHPFPAKQILEDGDFVLEAKRHDQIVSVDAGLLQVASIHAGNTSPRQLSGSDGWHRVTAPKIDGELKDWVRLCG